MAPNKEKPKGPMAALAAKVKDQEERITELVGRVAALENPMRVKSINKVETHAGEVPVDVQRESRLSLQDESIKVQSARNASKLLPPNLVDSQGRHTPENLQAICGFKMTPEIYSLIYPETEDIEE